VRGQALAEDRLDLGEDLLVGGDEQGFLVLEMVEEARALDAHPIGDLLHFGADQAVAGEDRLRRVDDALAGVVGRTVGDRCWAGPGRHAGVYLQVCRYLCKPLHLQFCGPMHGPS